MDLHRTPDEPVSLPYHLHEALEAYHQVPEVQISIHLGDSQDPHVVEPTGRGDREFILALWALLLLRQMFERLAQFGKERDVCVRFGRCLGVLVVDLATISDITQPPPGVCAHTSKLPARQLCFCPLNVAGGTHPSSPTSSTSFNEDLTNS